MSHHPATTEPTDQPNTVEKTNQLLGYVEQLVTYNEQQQEMKDVLAQMLDEKVEEIALQFETRFDDFKQSLTETFEHMIQSQSPLHLPENVGGENEPTPFELPAVEDEAQLSDWERKKRQFLMDQGFKPQDNIQEKLSTPKVASGQDQSLDLDDNSTGSVNPMDLVEEDQEQELEALQDSIDSIQCVDSEEIEELNELLSTKLRDAEVELSINRAKLSQQWAALEQKQYELAQQESIMQAKYGDMDETKKKVGILDRLSRHLSRSDQDEEE